MKEIYNIIQKLRENNSSNYKIGVLEGNKDNEKLKRFLDYCYNSKTNYYITELPESELFRHYTNDMDEESFYGILDKLKNREITGNKAREEFSNQLSFCGGILTELYDLVISRDIKCGVNVKSINRVFPNLILKVPYCRCSSLKDTDLETLFNYKGEAIAQLKSDGVFSYIIKKDNKLSFLTRNGTSWCIPQLEEVLEKLPNNTVLIGEALIKHNGKVMDRKTGNGLITKFIKRETTLESLNKKLQEATTDRAKATLESKIKANIESYQAIESRLCFDLWDMLNIYEFDYEYSGIAYGERLRQLERVLSTYEISDRFQVIETTVIHSVEEALGIAQCYINSGFEGAVIKHTDMVFENGTSKFQIKIKEVKDCDLLVVGIEEGKGKYLGKVGALICESSCGRLRVNVGSGLTDEDRGREYSHYLGKIVEIKYNEVINKKGSEFYSLFLPIFREVRDDKSEADTSERILNE